MRGKYSMHFKCHFAVRLSKNTVSKEGEGGVCHTLWNACTDMSIDEDRQSFGQAESCRNARGQIPTPLASGTGDKTSEFCKCIYVRTPIMQNVKPFSNLLARTEDGQYLAVHGSAHDAIKCIRHLTIINSVNLYPRSGRNVNISPPPPDKHEYLQIVFTKN